MKLVITKDLKSNNYEVTINIENMTEDELELLSDFGDPVINTGGKFVDSEEEEILALGDLYKKIPSEMPFTKVFSQSQYGENAEKVANAFADEIVLRAQTAIEELKSRQDGFSGVTEIIL